MPEPEVSKTALKAAIDEAEALEEDDYTEETWTALAEALAEAKTVYADKDATQSQVDNAKAALADAIADLEEKSVAPSVNKDALEALYNANKDKEQGDFTDESWAAFQNALANAKAVLDNADATQAEVNAAAAKLNAAIEGLEEPSTNPHPVRPDDTPVLPTVPVTNKLPFRDVREGDWYYDAVKYVYNNGLMNGTGSNTFSPLSNTTRSMIVTILYRQSGSPSVTSDNASWWSDARVWAMENGISDGTNMDGKITREQLAAMLYRYAKLLGADVSARGSLNKFSDAAQVSAWAVESVQWAVGEGILTGRLDGSLDPKGLATRAEVATMLMRFCQNIG